MRITKLHVDGFGLLHDVDVEGVGAGLTVVLGPNEAGKSTLHAFLTRTLLGHPRARNAAGTSRYEPLNGGKHGGWIEVLDDDGGTWRVHRQIGGSRPLRVLRPDGTETGGANAVVDLVGAGMDLDRFEQVYAIDVDALSGLGNLEGDTLQELLFDAATVGTGRSLRGARDDAAARRDELWTAKATKKPLSLALRRRADAETALAEAQAVSGSYGERRTARDAAATQMAELREQQDEARREIALLQRVQDAWPSWQLLADAADGSDVALDGGASDVDPVPTATIDDEASAREALTAARTALSERETQIADLEDQRLALAGDATEEPWAESVRRLHGRLGVHQDAVARLSRARGASDEAKGVLADRLAELGDGWDDASVAGVATDAASRERLALAGDALTDARREVELTGRAQADHVASVNRLLEGLEHRRARHADAPDEAEVRRAEEALAVLRARLPELERAALQADRQRSFDQSGGGVSMVLFGLLAGAILVASVLAQLLAGTGIGVRSIALSVLVAAPIGFALAYLLRRPDAPRAVPDAPAEASEVTAAMQQDVARAAKILDLETAPSMLDVEQVAGRVGQARVAVDAAAAIARELQDLGRQHADQRAQSDDAARAAGVAVEDLMMCHAAWVEACDVVGVIAEDEPRVTLAAHARVTDVSRAAAVVERASREARELETQVAELLAEVVQVVAEATGSDAAPDDAVRMLETLHAQVGASADRRRDHARLTQELERQQERHAALLAEVEAATLDLAFVWESVGTSDAASFAARIAAAAAGAAQAGARAEAAARVDELLGTSEAGAAGRALLAQADPTAWEAGIADRERDIAELDEQRDAVVREHTELAGEVDRLGGDDAVARAQQDLEAAKTDVATLAERWAIADAAARLLDTTLQQFEREQQPVVLARASQLFETATLGAWAEVRRFDESLVVAETSGGEPCLVDDLSRGTREQLYLSLRLALAEELSDGRRLPLLIDDLLGTTDPERSAAVARMIGDVATRHQVWLFTPTPATADLLTEVDPTAAILELDRGGTVRGWRVAPTKRAAVPGEQDDETQSRLEL